jgi:Prophage minor tail protein Z (GPZ)
VFTIAFRTDSPAAVAKLREKAPVAIARALNKSIASAQTIMLRVISSDLKVKVSDLRDKVRIQQATPAVHTARIYASAKRIPLIDFGAKGPEPSRGCGRGVTAKLGGGRSRYPNAFIATMKSGHRGVFQRGSKGNLNATRRGPAPNRSQLPIRELFGPSIAHVFQKNEAVGLARAQEQLAKNLKSEFRFVLAIEGTAAAA